ncbi:MAG: tetratricopeptide repeat protein, partial [Rhodospirillales bacterium]
PTARVRRNITAPARGGVIPGHNALAAAALTPAATDDALPLLAFALRELYDRHAGTRQLTIAHYRSLGDEKEGLSPLENAVRRRADEVLEAAKPAPEDLKALKDAFVPAMVRVNAAGEYVRQPARLDTLPVRAHPLIERLAKARLLIVRREGADTVVEVAHEALLRKWRRLRAWLDEEREFLMGKDQLERDLHDWDKAPEAQKADALLTGLKLTRARAWLVEKPHQLSDAERRFIRDSIDHHEAIRRRQERFQRYVRLGAVAGALVLGVAAAIAFWQRSIAERNYATAVAAAANIVNVVDLSTDSFAINPQMAQNLLDVTRDTFGKLLAEKEDPVAIRAQVQLLEVRARSYLVLGDLQAALAAAKEANERARGFAAKDPDNVEWQTIIAKSYRRLGDIGQDAGTLDAALEARLAWKAVAEKLARRFPQDKARQADLAFSLEKLGDTLRRQGRIDETLAVYRPAKEILQKLTDEEPDKPNWRLELGFAHERMSDMLRAKGDFAAAVVESTAYRGAFETLTKKDPSNTYWQRGLGLGNQRLGDSLLGAGDHDGALQRFTEYNGIAAGLVRIDQTNMDWKRDWAVSFAKLGEAHLAKQRPQDAIESYHQYHKIATELSERDAKNTTWRHDKAVSHVLVGDALLALSKPDDALKEYRQFNAIAKELHARNTSSASARRSLALSHHRIAEVHRLQGRLPDALEGFQACLSLDATDMLANPTFLRPAKLNDECRRKIEETKAQIAGNR